MGVTYSSPLRKFYVRHRWALFAFGAINNVFNEWSWETPSSSSTVILDESHGRFGLHFQLSGPLTKSFILGKLPHLILPLLTGMGLQYLGNFLLRQEQKVNPLLLLQPGPLLLLQCRAVSAYFIGAIHRYIWILFWLHQVELVYHLLSST